MIRWSWRRFDDVVSFVVDFGVAAAVTQLPLRLFIVRCCCWWACSVGGGGGGLVLMLLLRPQLTMTLTLMCNSRRTRSRWSRRKHSRRMERPRCIAAGCSPGKFNRTERAREWFEFEGWCGVTLLRVIKIKVSDYIANWKRPWTHILTVYRARAREELDSHFVKMSLKKLGYSEISTNIKLCYVIYLT